MFLLDSDHVSLIDRGGTAGANIRARLRRVPPDDVCACIVSYEEQIRGWTAVIAQARTIVGQIPFYSELQRLLGFYCTTPLLPFDAQAAAVFERLKTAKIRIGTMDLKIASIALAHDATLLTRNLADFRKVPALKAEDWSA